MTPLETGRDYLAPRDSVEQALTEIWGRLLRLDRVGVHDDFFELGGHSLVAIRLVSQIRKELGVEIPLRTIFESPSVERLAVQIAKRQAASMASEDVEQLLKQLEEMPEEIAEQQLPEHTEPAASCHHLPRQSPGSPPLPAPRPLQNFLAGGMNIVIVMDERFKRKGFEKLAGCVREFDPSIHAVVARDRAPMDVALPRNPTLIFSPASSGICPKSMDAYSAAIRSARVRNTPLCRKPAFHSPVGFAHRIPFSRPLRV